MTTRRQATLYLPAPYAAPIEQLRARYNPVQHALIGAHVTLCREDEVSDWYELARRLAEFGPIEVPLAFSAPIRSDNLVYLPAVGSTAAFDELRYLLLAQSGGRVRQHQPHITLIHPRNGQCTTTAFASIASACVPFAVTFRLVSLIEQIDGNRWLDWSGQPPASSTALVEGPKAFPTVID